MTHDTTNSSSKSKTQQVHQRTKNAGPSLLASSKGDVHEAQHTTEHTFLTDVADVRQMEHSLLQLLDDFHLGKLQAFGRDCTFEKMDEVRERQERLARLHFDLDNQQDTKRSEGSEAQASGKNFDKLMGSLHELCSAVQNLQKDEQPTQASQPAQ